MNKMITYYETKLSKILPLYLIPNRNPNFTITQEIFYRDLIREIYSCLTYKISLDPPLAEIMITPHEISLFLMVEISDKPSPSGRPKSNNTAS